MSNDTNATRVDQPDVLDGEASDYESPAVNQAAHDSLDALDDGDGEPETARPAAGKRRPGRPKGGTGKGPTKDVWRARARAAAQDVKRLTAERDEARAAAAAGPGAPTAGESVNMLREALDASFGLWFLKQAETRGAHWLLSKEEHEKLVNVWTRALEPWAPQMAQYAPWGAAISATFMVWKPRAKIDAAARAELVKEGEPRVTDEETPAA